ncbi:MAG: hypothetical protein V3T09_08320 [bacterium]
MGQYYVGLVDVDNSSQIVIGVGTLWNNEIKVGDIFGLQDNASYYIVGNVDSDTQITLTANYAGITQAGVTYYITRDFTPIYSLPYPTQGDVQTATIVGEMTRKVDSLAWSVGVHNNLTGVQGGSTSEFYHVNELIYNDLTTNQQLEKIQIDGTPKFERVQLGNVSITEFDATPKGYVDAMLDDSFYSTDSTWTSFHIRNKIAALIDDASTSLDTTLSSAKIYGLTDDSAETNVNTWSAYKIISKITSMIDDFISSDFFTWSSSKIALEIRLLIDDLTTSPVKTWSSEEIDNRINILIDDGPPVNYKAWSGLRSSKLVDDSVTTDTSAWSGLQTEEKIAGLLVDGAPDLETTWTSGHIDNQIKSGGGGGAIDDGAISLKTTWSSEKLNNELDGKIDNLTLREKLTDWHSAALPVWGRWGLILWIPELEIFCSFDMENNEGMCTSANGVDWVYNSFPSMFMYVRVALWIPELSKIIALNTKLYDYNTDLSVISSDGTTWEQIDTPRSDWSGLAWSDSLSLLCAVSSSPWDSTGVIPQVMTSPDGVTWTAVMTPENNSAWSSIAWSEELTTFLAVASAGTHRIMFSPNGVDWTLDIANFIGTESTVPTCVIWHAQTSKFYISNDSSLYPSQYSTDGIVWWGVYFSYMVGSKQIKWIDDLELFILVSSQGGLSISYDGIHWEILTHLMSALDNSWFSVAWSAKLQMMICATAVGAEFYNHNSLMVSRVK